MAAVFRHGGLRLYLLQLLDEQPRHGYDVISLLEDRFMGLYAPSAGTVYPRLAKLETEGLVEHDDEEGGRKVYRLTDAGRAELADHDDELRDLEDEISRSVADLARDVRSEVRESVRGLREELKTAAREIRRETRAQGRHARAPGPASSALGVAALAEAISSLTRDAMAAARDADEGAVDTALDVIRRARADVLAALGEHG